MAVTDSVAGGLRAAELGATHLLIRWPSASIREQCEVLGALVRSTSVPVLARGRADLALATGAAGVNLPEDDVGAAAARKLLGPDRLVGLSVHSVERAIEAAAGPVDFVVLGPIFATPTHPGSLGLGLDALAEAARRTEVPILAIGGIDMQRAVACLDAGAGGYAAIRMFR